MSGADMEHRPYRDRSDLERMRRLLMQGAAAMPHNGYWHVGDLEWTAFGPHGFPLNEIFQIWEDVDALAGFVSLSAGSFDYQVARGLRGTAIEREMIDWGQRAVLAWRAANALASECAIECWTNDAHRIETIESLGYRRTDRGAVILYRSLDGNLPEPSFPSGWEVRGLREADIESRAITQYMAFAPGSKTTPETWRHLYDNAPNYDADLDNVAVTPDGTVVAAALVWLDEQNLIGEFEPVGTRPEYQRRGLAKAILLRGLAKMRERGMRTAKVGTNATNAAAIAAYESVGFVIHDRIVEYELMEPAATR